MGVRVTHTIGDLAADLRTMTRKAPTELKKVVRKNAIEGNALARKFASEQHTMVSRYDVHYPRSFTWDSPRSYYGGTGGGAITAEYGPDTARKQGGMAPGFERAVGKQAAPHRNLERSANVIAWQFGPNVLHAAGKLFWPES